MYESNGSPPDTAGRGINADVTDLFTRPTIEKTIKGSYIVDSAPEYHPPPPTRNDIEKRCRPTAEKRKQLRKKRRKR